MHLVVIGFVCSEKGLFLLFQIEIFLEILEIIPSLVPPIYTKQVLHMYMSE